MFDENICRFIPQNNEPESIHTLNFVYEKRNPRFEGFRFLPTYRMHLVTKGSGMLHTPGRTYPLTAGDLFFVFPSAAHRIDEVEAFEYMYISFIGTRANHILDALHISNTNFLFHGFGALEDFWTDAIRSGSVLFNLTSECVLLYTFSKLASQLVKEDNTGKTATATVSLIKKFIDDNFSDPTLSLDRISEELSYNKKYISRTFKKEMYVNITDYITTIRIHQACALMDQGFTSIRDISQLCGFRDSLYFSRVFKQELGISPKEYVTNKK